MEDGERKKGEEIGKVGKLDVKEGSRLKFFTNGLNGLCFYGLCVKVQATKQQKHVIVQSGRKQFSLGEGTMAIALPMRY